MVGTLFRLPFGAMRRGGYFDKVQALAEDELCIMRLTSCDWSGCRSAAAGRQSGVPGKAPALGSAAGPGGLAGSPVVACFTPGTLIATPKGEVPVEDLRVGDRVITRDDGLQELRWTASRRIDPALLAAHPHLKPIAIRQGSLGRGLPERDMMVSPNHRMLVARNLSRLHVQTPEALVAAKHLVAGRGIHQVDCAGITYLHVMFDRHQVVLANGCWTESYRPTAQLLDAMGNAQRQELFELFPDLRSPEGLAAYGAARPAPVPEELQALLR